jgi:hypothetical protein
MLPVSFCREKACPTSVASLSKKSIVKESSCKYEEKIKLFSLAGERSEPRLNRVQHDPIVHQIVGKN